MANDSYDSLTEMWKRQRENYREWQFALNRAAHTFRNTVASKVGGPESWESYDKRQQRRYIEIVDLSSDNKPVTSLFPDAAITNDGELCFGLSFTFDHGLNTYPKALYHVALAVRFSNSQPQFSFWDTKSNRPEEGGSWSSDADSFADGIIERLISYFSFNPFEGSAQRPAIGFVQT